MWSVLQGGDIGGPCGDGFGGLLSPVEGCPLWLFFEQTHGLEVVVDVQSKAVVDPSRLGKYHAKPKQHQNQKTK